MGDSNPYSLDCESGILPRSTIINQCSTIINQCSTIINQPFSLRFQVAGIRKVGSRDPNLNFLSWHPAAEELRRAPPQMSMYKVDYHVKDRANVHGQKFVNRPQTSFDCGRPLTTMYRYSHGAENPNQATLNELNNINRQVAPTHKRETNTDTVASCMSWHWPCPPRRERLIPYNQQSAPYDTDLPRTPPHTAPPSPRPPPCTNIIAA